MKRIDYSPNASQHEHRYDTDALILGLTLWLYLLSSVVALLCAFVGLLWFGGR